MPEKELTPDAENPVPALLRAQLRGTERFHAVWQDPDTDVWHSRVLTSGLFLAAVDPAPPDGTLFAADATGGARASGVTEAGLGSAFSVLFAGVDARALILTPQSHITTSRALTDADAGKRLGVDTSSGAVALTVGTGLATNWHTELVRGGGSVVTVSALGGASLIGPAVVGGTVTIGVEGTSVRLFQLAPGLFFAQVVASPGTAAQALDAIAPTVQDVYTDASRTIVVGDVNQILRLSSALNAVDVTVPGALFGALGTGRAFSFEGVVDDITNPIQLLSSELTFRHYGLKNTLTAVGDTFTVLVVSASEAWVYIAERLP